ncbi:MAG: hypothetical protein AMXMBFR7_26690 [Planctomycetota bacterium]
MSTEVEEHRREQERAAAHIAREARKRAKAREALKAERDALRAELDALRETFRLKPKEELLSELNGKTFAWGGIFVSGGREERIDFQLNAGLIGSEMVATIMEKGFEHRGLALWNCEGFHEGNRLEQLRGWAQTARVGFALSELRARCSLCTAVALTNAQSGYYARRGPDMCSDALKTAFAKEYKQRMGWAKDAE